MAVPDCYPPVHLLHLEFSAVPELMSLRALSTARVSGQLCTADSVAHLGRLDLERSGLHLCSPAECWACPMAAAHRVSTPFYSIRFL